MYDESVLALAAGIGEAEGLKKISLNQVDWFFYDGRMAARPWRLRDQGVSCLDDHCMRGDDPATLCGGEDHHAYFTSAPAGRLEWKWLGGFDGRHSGEPHDGEIKVSPAILHKYFIVELYT